MLIPDIAEDPHAKILDLENDVVEQIRHLLDHLALAAMLLNDYVSSLPRFQDEVSYDAADKCTKSHLQSSVYNFNPSQRWLQA